MKRIVLFISIALLSLFVRKMPTSVQADNILSLTAVPAIYTVTVNDQDYSLRAYKIGGEVYFKWRDIAFISNKTVQQFQVEWDETNRAVNVTQDRAYSPVGGELQWSDTMPAEALPAPTIYISGSLCAPGAYLIHGNTYQKLEEIASLVYITHYDRLEVSVDTETQTAVIGGVHTQEYVREDEFSLTLRADNREALLNGKSYILPAAPFMKDDSFYFPLEAVTKLLGGGYTFNNNAALVELFGVTTVYSIGSPIKVVNGERVDLTRWEMSASSSDLPSETFFIEGYYAPILVDKVVYIPYGFSQFAYPKYTISVQAFPELGMVIMGTFANEEGVDGIKNGYFYNYIREELRAELKNAGTVSDFLNYHVLKYYNENIEIYVTRLKPGEIFDMAHMDGKICGLIVTGGEYTTPRGLRVGDSKERAVLLYGQDDGERNQSPRPYCSMYKSLNLEDHFLCVIENDTVTSFGFSTRWFNPYNFPPL